MDQNLNNPTPLEQPAAVATRRRSATIGLPRSNDPRERRFPLTPEAAGLLVEAGYTILMESRAAETIHYTDNQYTHVGVRITSRQECLAADVLLSMSIPPATDVASMRRGALLLTLLGHARDHKESLKILLKQGVITLALNLIEDKRGNLPFADILHEIDGRAAMAHAAAMLADATHGKGILLGGIAGVNPCEVTIIGSDIAACASARSASGAGALVKMFDNDIYRLRDATRYLGDCVTGSALHPRVLHNALRTADVVVVTDVDPQPSIVADIVAQMKRGVVIFDLSSHAGRVFPSLPVIDIATNKPLDISAVDASRACYVNAGSLVPRTTAMAISDTLLKLLADIHACEGVTNALKLHTGLQRAALTFVGKAVNPRVARATGTRHFDINLYLTLS